MPDARVTDPATSHEAAKSVRDCNGKQVAVLTLLQMMGDATDEELGERYARRMNAQPKAYPYQSPSGLRTRRHELVEAGLVEPVNPGPDDSARAAAKNERWHYDATLGQEVLERRLLSGRYGIVWTVA